MCSSFEDGDIRPLKVDACDLRMKECMKCKKNLAQVVIRVNDAFCKDCFLLYCTHKFRSAFGKSKIIRDGEKVLVAFSGGQASTAMLHLVMEGKSVRAQKKLRFLPGLLFVDDREVLGLSESSRQCTLDRIKQLFTASGYPYHIVQLEQLFEGRPEDGTPKELVANLFGSVQTLTAKEQLLKTLRRQVISEVAKAEGYSKVIVGDTSSRLSVAILANMAQGKGAHIPYDTSLLDDRDSELYLVRPMKDFTSKEVAMYNKFYNLEAETIPTFTTKGLTGASIDRLTESFVTGLQADFPSTINTIMRTGDKLMNTRQEGVIYNTASPTCSICKAPLDTFVSKSSALESMRYSQVLSQRRIKENSLSAASEDESALSEFVEACCYSCQQMLRDMPKPDLLPPGTAAAKGNRLAMRDYIADSLLS